MKTLHCLLICLIFVQHGYTLAFSPNFHTQANIQPSDAIYDQINNISEVKGDYKKALNFYKKQKRVIHTQKQQIDSLLKDQQKSYVSYYGLAVFAVSLIIGGFLWFRTANIKIRKNRQLLEASQALIQAELENKKLKEKELQRALELKSQELTSFSMNLIQKNEIIEELRENMNMLKKTPAEQVPQQLKNMRRLLDNSLHIDKEWEDFKLHFAQVHPSLFRNLKERFPELSTNDLKVCALIKLNLNLKEAAGILGIAPESVKSARYRLRKKFGLSHHESLVDFIHSIDEERENMVLSA